MQAVYKLNSRWQQNRLSKRQNLNRCKLSIEWLWAANDAEVQQINEILEQRSLSGFKTSF